MAQELWAAAEFAGNATVEGALYKVGSYSGLVDEPGGRVHGEVARLLNPDQMLARLDAYEGRDYVRVERTATLDSGTTVQAMVYQYAGKLDGATRIASGIWV